MISQRGFSLVELMISLVLGLIVTGAVIQVFVSTNVTNQFNQTVSEVQEAGRFISARLQKEFQEAGRYDVVTTNIDSSVDLVTEAAYIESKAVAIVGDFDTQGTLGSREGSSGANDAIVLNLLAAKDCTGNTFDYVNGALFHTVNYYYVTDNALKCSGYDGRVLRGLKNQISSGSAITLLDNVERFQLEYGVSDEIQQSDGSVIQYITADQLANARANGQIVVSVKFALLLKSRQELVIETAITQRTLLGEAPIDVNDNHYYQVFSHAIALRNGINLVGSTK